MSGYKDEDDVSDKKSIQTHPNKLTVYYIYGTELFEHQLELNGMIWENTLL